MYPSLYLYKETSIGFELYFHEISTIDGLKAIPESDKIRLTSVGATLFQNKGYATEKDFPEFAKSKELIKFLIEEGEIGLIELEVEIIGKGTMLSYYDRECHFALKNKKDAIEILKNLTPDSQTDFIVSTLLSNNGLYISVDNENNVKKYASLDQYRKK